MPGTRERFSRYTETTKPCLEGGKTGSHSLMFFFLFFLEVEKKKKKKRTRRRKRREYNSLTTGDNTTIDNWRQRFGEGSLLFFFFSFSSSSSSSLFIFSLILFLLFPSLLFLDVSVSRLDTDVTRQLRTLQIHGPQSGSKPSIRKGWRLICKRMQGHCYILKNWLGLIAGNVQILLLFIFLHFAPYTFLNLFES